MHERRWKLPLERPTPWCEAELIMTDLFWSWATWESWAATQAPEAMVDCAVTETLQGGATAGQQRVGRAKAF